MELKEFEAEVRRALDRLPKRFAAQLKNVAVVVEESLPEGEEELTGLYEGIPITEKSFDESGVLPDRIILYKQEIEDECREEGLDLREHITHVLRHEIAHHFGISDERLDDLGVY